MVLPRGLKRGAWMELDDSDIRSLVQAAGGAPPHREPGARTAAGPSSRGNPRGNARPGSPRGPARGGQNGRGNRPDKGGDAQGSVGQPDPMKTSLGYIGADSFTRQRNADGPRLRGNGGGPKRGGRNR